VIILSIRINVPVGYDLLSSIHSWIYPDIQPVPERTGTGYFGRVYEIGGQQVAVIIHQKTPGASLLVEYSSQDVERNALRNLIRRILNIDFDIGNALGQMSEDSVIAHLVPHVAGVRPYMSPTPYEALIKTIIQQQVSYKSANVFTKRMVEGLTEPVSFKDETWYGFPNATILTETGMNGLREFGFGYKVEYIHRAASLVASGELELSSLVGVPFKDVCATLKPIRGIGDWTIRVLSLAGLGNFEVFAHDDLVIQKILGNLYNNGKRMTTKEVRTFSQRWGDASTMVLYLLMSAEVLGFLKT